MHLDIGSTSVSLPSWHDTAPPSVETIAINPESQNLDTTQYILQEQSDQPAGPRTTYLSAGPIRRVEGETGTATIITQRKQHTATTITTQLTNLLGACWVAPDGDATLVTPGSTHRSTDTRQIALTLWDPHEQTTDVVRFQPEYVHLQLPTGTHITHGSAPVYDCGSATGIEVTRTQQSQPLEVDTIKPTEFLPDTSFAVSPTDEDGVRPVESGSQIDTNTTALVIRRPSPIMKQIATYHNVIDINTTTSEDSRRVCQILRQPANSIRRSSSIVSIYPKEGAIQQPELITHTLTGDEETDTQQSHNTSNEVSIPYR